MPKVQGILLAGLLITLTGCVSVNQVPPLLNLKANDKVANFAVNGGVAFNAAVKYRNRDQALVFVQDEKGQFFEIPLNPKLTDDSVVTLGPLEVYRKETARDQSDFGVLLYQLPAGTYRTKYLVIWHEGSNFPKDLQEEEFRVDVGKVVYWGQFLLESDASYLADKAFQVQRVGEIPQGLFGSHRFGELPEVTVVETHLNLRLKKK